MPYRWVPTAGGTGRYQNTKNGRFVPASTVRDELDNYLANSSEPIEALSTQLREGQVNVQYWKTAMKREIKNAHLNSVAESVGGYQNMTPEHYGRAGAYIKQQYGYLNDFADQISNGTQKLDGTLTRRMELYVKAGRESYYKSIQSQLSGDVTHIGSVKSNVDNCADCIRLDGKWFERGDSSYITIGNRICNKNCKCSERYGLMVEGAIVEVSRA